VPRPSYVFIVTDESGEPIHACHTERDAREVAMAVGHASVLPMCLLNPTDVKDVVRSYA
jgi:hypothetical protein